jgi:hypothetical protein
MDAGDSFSVMIHSGSSGGRAEEGGFIGALVLLEQGTTSYTSLPRLGSLKEDKTGVHRLTMWVYIVF